MSLSSKNTRSILKYFGFELINSGIIDEKYSTTVDKLDIAAFIQLDCFSSTSSPFKESDSFKIGLQLLFFRFG